LYPQVLAKAFFSVAAASRTLTPDNGDGHLSAQNASMTAFGHRTVDRYSSFFLFHIAAPKTPLSPTPPDHAFEACLTPQFGSKPFCYAARDAVAASTPTPTKTIYITLQSRLLAPCAAGKLRPSTYVCSTATAWKNAVSPSDTPPSKSLAAFLHLLN